MASNWTDDWSTPPINDDQLECWRIYTVIFKDLNLISPAYYILRWLRVYGLPTATAMDRYYQRALDIYMLPGVERRRC